MCPYEKATGPSSSLDHRGVWRLLQCAYASPHADADTHVGALVDADTHGSPPVDADTEASPLVDADA